MASVGGEPPLAVRRAVHESLAAHALQLQCDLSAVAAAEILHQLHEELRSTLECLAHTAVAGRPWSDGWRNGPPVVNVVWQARRYGGVEADFADGTALVYGVVQPGPTPETRLDNDVAV